MDIFLINENDYNKNIYSQLKHFLETKNSLCPLFIRFKEFFKVSKKCVHFLFFSLFANFY